MPSPFQEHLDNERAIKNNAPTLPKVLTTDEVFQNGRWVNINEKLPPIGKLVYTRSPSGLIGAYKRFVTNWNSWVSIENEPIAEWFEELDAIKELGNFGRFSQMELAMLPDDNLIKPLASEITALVNRAVEGHSGGSYEVIGPIIAEAVKLLLAHKPLGPLTGQDEEWMEVVKDLQTNEIIYQNKRCGTVFKNTEGKAWYLDAVGWRTQNDRVYSGSAVLPDGTVEYGRQFIKSFPFEPKTFIIDIIEEEVKPDFWEFYLQDAAQMNEVFEYYERYQPT